MPYVRRDAEGRIVALFEQPEADADEWLAAGDPQLREFIGDDSSPEGYLELSDLELVRVVEDLIHLLIDKNLILITELPVEAQRKLTARRSARERLREGGTPSFSLSEEELL